MAAEEKTEKIETKGSKILIMGGCGFIGRHLLQYLVAKDCCSEIFVADKLIPELAYLTEAQMKLFKDPENRVKLIQSDLSKPQHIEKVFFSEKGLKGSCDFIINLCGETRFGQSDEDYKIKNLNTAMICAEAALKLNGLKKWIEISTSQIYKPKKEPVDEKQEIEPWTRLAKYRYQAEQNLQNMQLPLVILRPSIVYGPGDKTGITPRLVCAFCYLHTKQKMSFLWTPNLCINTVHVRDVCNAIFHCLGLPNKNTLIYNLSDQGNTTQGTFNTLIENIFKIKTGFEGKLINKAAKNMMDYVSKGSNDRHLPIWSDVCKKWKLDRSPLSPYIDKEILSKNYLCIDGNNITKTGFKYKYKQIIEPYIEEILTEYEQQEFLPKLTDMQNCQDEQKN